MKYSKRRQSKQSQSAPTPVETEQQKQAQLSLDAALDLFLIAQDAMNHSEVTKKDYKRVIGGRFLRYIKETYSYVEVRQVSEKDILEWLAYLRNASSRLGRPYSSRTIETYSRDVAAFFSWLTEHKHIPANPMASVKRPKVEKVLIRIFTEDELKSLDAACNRPLKGRSLTEDERKALAARDRAFLWLLLSTGVRVSEACGLTFADIDWKEDMIYVRGKGAKERRIPFGKVAKQHLDTYVRYWRGEPLDTVRSEDCVFLNAFGSPLSPSAAGDIFERLKKVAGITDKRVSPHTCRHWFAVNAIKSGMPTVVLKNILGHANWNMIEVYVQLAEQDLKQSYARFSPVDTLEMHRYPKGKRSELRDWRNSRKKGV